MNIEMKKISELDGFDADEFCIKPSYSDLEWVNTQKYPEVLAEATKLAEAVDGICIALIRDELKTYVLGESCCNGCSSKFMLFNAAKTERGAAEVRAITFNTGRGALTAYWYDEWIKFQKGSIA